MSFLGGGGKGNFDRLLESATSQMLLEPSWATNLEICDVVRQNDVSPKYALAAIRKKMKDPNPHICKFALVVLEACVKNCGQSFHEEIPNHDFMDDMRTLAQNGSAPVKEQVLTMLQAWNHAFRNKTQFQPILATYNLMKMEGYQFPVLSDSDAMFSADAAPTWKDGDVCHMCRVKFATFTRQHHCRACGEAFCGKCSSKQSIIPNIGIEREVRVCDPCYDEINPDDGKQEVKGATKVEGDLDLPAEYLNSDLAKEPQTKPALGDEAAKEEEEMQLALALSLSENEANKSISKNQASHSSPSYGNSTLLTEARKVEPRSTLFTQVSENMKMVEADSSSELSKYLDRSYWERKSASNNNALEPTAPVQVNHVEVIEDTSYDYASNQEADNNEEERHVQSSVFVQTMEKSIEMFIERMNNVQMKGKHIAMDSTVQSLFQSLSAMHPQLIRLIEDEEDSKAKYEAMIQKLAVIRGARDSLNDMRAQHQEKVRQQELEQEMLRRMQMEQKLELMRQQKQEYLEYQHQLQIQRQQELDVYQQEKLRQRQIPNFPGNDEFVGQLNTPQYQNQSRVPSSSFGTLKPGGLPNNQFSPSIPEMPPVGLSQGTPSRQHNSVSNTAQPYTNAPVEYPQQQISGNQTPSYYQDGLKNENQQPVAQQQYYAKQNFESVNQPLSQPTTPGVENYYRQYNQASTQEQYQGKQKLPNKLIQHESPMTYPQHHHAFSKGSSAQQEQPSMVHNQQGQQQQIFDSNQVRVEHQQPDQQYHPQVTQVQQQYKPYSHQPTPVSVQSAQQLPLHMQPPHQQYSHLQENNQAQQYPQYLPQSANDQQVLPVNQDLKQPMMQVQQTQQIMQGQQPQQIMHGQQPQQIIQDQQPQQIMQGQQPQQPQQIIQGPQPAQLSNYPQAGQGAHVQQGYPNQQQPPQYQQYPNQQNYNSMPNQPMEELSSNVKDLQLISFD